MIKLMAALVGLAVLSSPTCFMRNDNNPGNYQITSETIEEIDSLDEWNEYLDDNGLDRDHSHDNSTAVDFRIAYDEEEQQIVTDVVYVDSATATTTSGSATHEVRSTGGFLIFTLTVNGTFSRVSGSSCTCTSASGSFTHPITSLWRSTPSYSKGRTSATRAYAKMYGTATQTIGTGSISYSFYLYCNSYGTLSSAYYD